MYGGDTNITRADENALAVNAEKSRVLGMLMGAMFEAAFRRFAEAFERRADAVYGQRL